MDRPLPIFPESRPMDPSQRQEECIVNDARTQILA